MTENQKLREALQAIANIDDATSHTADASAALDRIGSIVRQALALPTADHLPDAGEMVVDHFPDATKMIETASLEAATAEIARLRAENAELQERIDATDASASVSGLTAAPVGEREAFEREMSKPPFEFCMDRWPDDGSSYAWPGNYVAYHTQCAWAVWQARAALSARKPLTSEQVKALKGEYGYSLAPVQAQADFINGIRCGEKAHGIDAAMRKDKP